MFKKIALFAFAILTILCLCITITFASDNKALSSTATNVITPMWTYLQLVHNGLQIDSSGLASMVSDINCYTGSVNKVRMNNYLQRYINGSWTTLNSWSQTAYDTYDYWGTTYYVYKGYNYRLLTYFYAYNGDTLIESTSLTTSIKSY